MEVDQPLRILVSQADRCVFLHNMYDPVEYVFGRILLQSNANRYQKGERQQLRKGARGRSDCVFRQLWQSRSHLARRGHPGRHRHQFYDSLSPNQGR